MSGKPALNPVLNPYTPGAGTRPPVLAGRDEEIARFETAAERVRLQRPEQGLALVGLRGVGKTVLLRTFVDIAESRGLHMALVEGSDAGQAAVRAIARHLRRVLLGLAGGERVARALRVLKSFSLTVPLGVKIEVEPLRGQADSGDLAADLTDLFSAVGQAAAEADTAFLVGVDEVQDMPPADLSALLSGLHRAAQDTLPVGAVLAGLPSTVRRLADAKSYAERMFVIRDIGRLSDADATTALVAPSEELGVSWDPAAAALVVERTEGYPYFLQEYGRHTWNVAEADPIAVADTQRAEPLVRRQLDEGFFRARLGRVPDGERRYLLALAGLGPGAHRSGAVAAAMERTTPQVGPIRERLITAGILYAPRYGYVAFTVPQFDDFVRRNLA